MSERFLQELAELDKALFIALQVELGEFDDEAFDKHLQQRAALVQQVAAQGSATQTQVQDIIERSRKLSSLAETVKAKLGEQLSTIQKGRRSQQAYQSVKYQE
ncbi:hypothetical protein [Oceanisphaera sp. W20_SRM_FM3]|uniref:hypothetical protein n=1 Tax=Oceanisphaera sp. W20_SRM_FM3 TaxID=3240267 RepID=UPI003F9985E0